MTADRTGALPVLGRPNTAVLAGGRSLDSQDTAGMRITWGWALNEARTAGWEVTYFFLGTRTYTADFSDLTGERGRVLGRPFVNAATGREDVVPVAYPGVGNGLLAFDAITGINLVAIPDAISRDVHVGGVTYCAGRGDCVYLADSTWSKDL